MTTLDQYLAIEEKIPCSFTDKPARIHMGVVQLSTDHSLETELPKITGKEAFIFSSRVHYSSQLSEAALQKIALGISSASSLIASDLAMDVMIFACTSATIFIGEDRVRHLLTIDRGKIPATNPWTAAKASFRYLGAKKVAVLSPYPAGVNFPMFQQLCREGFDVSKIISFGIEHDTDITNIAKQSLSDALERIVVHTKPEAIFAPCTNLRILDHLNEFEQKFETPIVTSITATYWHAMHLVGKRAQCPGYGILLNC